MKNEGTEKKRLIIVLIVLVVLIVGLIVGIIIATSPRTKENVACEEMEDEYDMRVCLSQENPGESGDRYDAMLDKAINDGDNELFGDLVMDRSSDLAIEGDCEKSFKWLDTVEKKYASQLSAVDLRGIYISAVDVAGECNDEAKEAYYQNKIDELYGDDVEGFMDDVNWDEDGNLIEDTNEGDEE